MKSQIDPYKILFPAGVAAAISGLVLWWVFQLGMIPFYPRQAHGAIMFFGFLWAFVAGFMMTAIPRMTNTNKASAPEIAVATFLIFAQSISSLMTYFESSVWIFLLQTLFLMAFVVRRFFVHRRVPFYGAMFIPFALLQCLSGVIIYFLSDRSDSAVLFLLAGEAFVLNLILGVGSRLIPVISRLPNALMPDELAPEKNFYSTLFLAVVFNSSFYMQTFYSTPAGITMRMWVVIWMAVKIFRLFTKPQQNTVVGWGLKLGIVFIVASYFMSLWGLAGATSLTAALLPPQHLLYIGAFTLITLMVASRVMLAHGGASLDYELKSKRILAIISLVFIAAILRFIMGADIASPLLVLSLAALIMALILWAWKFVKVSF